MPPVFAARPSMTSCNKKASAAVVEIQVILKLEPTTALASKPAESFASATARLSPSPFGTQPRIFSDPLVIISTSLPAVPSITN